MIQIKISNFEGPLDVLIHLIEKKKLKINDINISQIIEDYINYIHQQKNLKLKIKVEFLTMATELLEIKAYSILNKEKKDEKIENLEKRLLEYKFFKEISQYFSQQENEYNIPYKRNNGKNIENAIIEYDFSKLTLENIMNSFKNLFNEEKKVNIAFNLEEEYTLKEATDEIKNMLKKNNNLEFSTLLKGQFNKNRIVTIFLSILELFKIGEIDIIFKDNMFYINGFND